MSSRRSTFRPSLAALGAFCCQPVLESEVPGSSPYLISEETPQGAEDWHQSEDGRRLRIHLPRGMRWSDGHPFAAEDVRFYWEDLNAHPDVFPFPDPDLVVNGKPMRFQVLDPHTVLFRFEDPYHRLPEIVASAFGRFGGGVFGEFLWGPYAPAHYLKQFHPSYVSPEDLRRKVRESQQEDWVGLMKLRNNYALNTDLARPDALEDRARAGQLCLEFLDGTCNRRDPEPVMVRPDQEVLCLRREPGEPSQTRKNCPETGKVYRNRTLRPEFGHISPIE